MEQDLLAFLKQSFSGINERFAAMEKRSEAMEKRSDVMEERFVAMEARVTQQIQAFRQETAERFENLETEVREVHIVVEDIQGKVQLTTEGIMNVNEKLDRHGDEVSQRFNDLEALVRDSDRAVATRVDRLEQKLKRAM
jgi:predicted  nucleic acid-binding Zn-ribbon protein